MEPTGDRRSAILDAAYACIAQRGYDRATTAQICQRAGVSSGTFFHYFPTKARVLVGVLERGLDEARRAAADLAESAAVDAPAAMTGWLDRLVAEAVDPGLTSFAAALSAAPDDPDVTEVLRAEAELAHQGLTALIAAGQRQGQWRTDIAPDRLATWIGILADGVLTRSIEDHQFDAGPLRPDLTEIVRRLLARQRTDDRWSC